MSETTPPDVDHRTPEEPEQRGSRFTLIATLAAMVAVAVMAVGALSWYRAAHDDKLADAEARDQALVAAKTEIATLNTLDYRHVDAGLAAWLRSTTGTLHDQLSQAGAKDTALLAQQQKITTGKVVAAALTDLDAERGTATAIASVEITVQGTTGAPTIKRNRFSADLVQTKQGWLLTSLQQVAVDVQ